MNRAPNRDRARTEWHGPLEAREIAKRCRFPSVQAVYDFWGREKAAGRLPDARRPFFLDSAPVADVFSGDESFSGRVPPGDPLLARLKRVHGNDPRRVIDARASGILQLIEYDIGAPSAGRLAAAQAMIDGAMRRAETAQLKQGVHA